VKRTVYIAASSADIERAEHWRDRLIAAGVTVTSSWMANVRKVGAGNPRDASDAQRNAWSTQCLIEVVESDVLWLLVPPAGVDTVGAWWEAGAASVSDVWIVASGDTRRTIFTARGVEYLDDETAFAAVLARCAP
jgi:hypothetical protein